MEAALRSLGTANRRDRVCRYIEGVAPPSEDLADFVTVGDPRLYTLERSAILESRRGRRHAQVLSLPDRPCHPLEPAVSPLQLPKRRRATDENARRAERTLGRAALLRPGRITLLPPNLQKPMQKVEQELDDLTQPMDMISNGVVEDFFDGWDHLEHSAYSNQAHEDCPGVQDCTSDIKTDPAFGPKAANPLTSSKLFSDFYLRNPTCLANGWLAERHHREILAGTELNRPLPIPAKLLSPSPLLGLCPLARKKAERRLGSKRY